MRKIEELKELFISKKGVLTTEEMNSIGLSEEWSRVGSGLNYSLIQANPKKLGHIIQIE